MSTDGLVSPVRCVTLTTLSSSLESSRVAKLLNSTPETTKVDSHLEFVIAYNVKLVLLLGVFHYSLHLAFFLTLLQLALNFSRMHVYVMYQRHFQMILGSSFQSQCHEVFAIFAKYYLKRARHVA